MAVETFLKVLKEDIFLNFIKYRHLTPPPSLMTRPLKKCNFFSGFFMLSHIIVVEAKVGLFIYYSPYAGVCCPALYIRRVLSVRPLVSLSSIFFCIFVLFFCFFFASFFQSVFLFHLFLCPFYFSVFFTFCLSLYISVFSFFLLLFFSYYLSVTKKKNMVVDDYEPCC